MDINMKQQIARNEFWITYDRLVAEGVVDIRQHPDYIEADAKCLEASKPAGGKPEGAA